MVFNTGKFVANFFVVMLPLMLVCLPSKAETDALDDFLNNMKTLTGKFEQVIIDAENTVIDQSSGVFWIERPGLLRWSYEKPYQQLLVVDGARVWTHDPDLEQVIVRAIDPATAGPAVLLLFDRAQIKEQYNIEKLAEQGAESRYRMSQLNEGNEIMHVDLRFRSGLLSSLSMRDSLQQTTRISFIDLQLNQPLPANLFQFVPPAGTDVVEQ